MNLNSSRCVDASGHYSIGEHTSGQLSELPIDRIQYPIEYNTIQQCITSNLPPPPPPTRSCHLYGRDNIGTKQQVEINLRRNLLQFLSRVWTYGSGEIDLVEVDIRAEVLQARCCVVLPTHAVYIGCISYLLLVSISHCGIQHILVGATQASFCPIFINGGMHARYVWFCNLGICK